MEFSSEKHKLTEITQNLDRLKKEILNSLMLIDQKTLPEGRRPYDLIQQTKSELIEKETKIRELQLLISDLTCKEQLLNEEIEKKQARIHELEKLYSQTQLKLSELSNKLTEASQLKDDAENRVQVLKKENQLITSELTKIKKELTILKSKNLSPFITELSILIRGFKKWVENIYETVRASVESNQPQIMTKEIDKLEKAIEHLIKVLTIPEPIFVEFPIVLFIEKFIMEMKMKYKDIDIQLDSKIEHDKMILSDMTYIHEILTHLVENSVESKTDKNIQIKIILEKPERISTFPLSITVIDNGIGISAHLISKLFVPFFTTKEGKYGLGLYRTKLLTDLLGGKIEIKSEQFKGTQVELFLPSYEQP